MHVTIFVRRDGDVATLRLSFQIRVVNAFQEPQAPSQLPYKGRPSFASIGSMNAALRAQDSSRTPHSPPPRDDVIGGGGKTADTKL